MLQAVKECMRNWVMAHKKLYWYIVVGLAVLAFGVITAIGCAKLEKAEAAVSVTLDTVVGQKEFNLSDYNNWMAISDTETSAFKFVILFDNILSVSENGSNAFYLKFDRAAIYSGVFVDPRILVNDGVAYGCNNYYLSPVSFTFNSKTYGGNYTPPSKYSFFAGGPYLRLKDDFYYNTPYDNSVHDNESIAGVPMLGNCSVASWKWIYKGSIGGYLKDYEGESTDIVPNTKVQCTLDVGIPSRAWVSDCMENLDVSGLRSLRTVGKRNEWKKASFRNGNMESSIVSFISNLFVTEDNKDFELTFSHTDMLEQIRESLGIDDWAEYYGVTDVQWDEYWSHIVFGYLTVNQMDSIVFNQYTDTDIMYGCYVSDVFTSGYNYSGYVYQDFFADSQVCLDAMKTELQEAYESVIAESEKKLEEYQAELDAINKELEMLRADDTSLFETFRKLANNLKNASGGFRPISVIVGNVFGFFPPEIMACLSFAFIALLVIAVVKALRG